MEFIALPLLLARHKRSLLIHAGFGHFCDGRWAVPPDCDVARKVSHNSQRTIVHFGNTMLIEIFEKRMEHDYIHNVRIDGTALCAYAALRRDRKRTKSGFTVTPTLLNEIMHN